MIRKIYISGPWGTNAESRKFLKSELEESVQKYGIPVHSLVFINSDCIAQAEKKQDEREKIAEWLGISHAFSNYSKKAMNLSSCLVAVLDGTDSDIVTVQDMHYFQSLDRPMIAYTGLVKPGLLPNSNALGIARAQAKSINDLEKHLGYYFPA